MKYAATVQYKGSRAQWTFSSVPRSDRMGKTVFGIEAANWDDALHKAYALYKKESAKFPIGSSQEVDFLLLSQEEPYQNKKVDWDKNRG